jgi:SAM-dependent methyltransferase
VNRQRLKRTAGQLVFGPGLEETAGHVSRESIGVAHPDAVRYAASPWWILRWLLPQSAVKPSDVFVELGCGKGRVVLDAARRYPFSRVVGVELAPDLSGVARELVERERGRLRSPDVRIETLDATAFPIPDDMTHVYLYNPFNGPTFERVCENIIASLDRAPRTVRLMYLHPADHATLMASGRFRLLRRVRTTRVVHESAAVYEAS